MCPLLPNAPGSILAAGLFPGCWVVPKAANGEGYHRRQGAPCPSPRWGRRSLGSSKQMQEEMEVVHPSISPGGHSTAPSAGPPTGATSCPLARVVSGLSDNKRSKAHLHREWTELSSPGSSVYYFKKTELISWKTGSWPLPAPDEPCGFAGQAGACPLESEHRVCSHTDVFVKVIHAVCLSDKYPNKCKRLSNSLWTRRSEDLSGRRGKACSPPSHRNRLMIVNIAL